jgi:hypothetical protein
MKKILMFALLAGCCGPEIPPGERWMSPIDRDLQRVRDNLYGARTMRIRFKGEWPWAVALMPKKAEGTVVLGEGDRAKISLAISYATGRSVHHAALSDGTRFWSTPGVEAAKFNPGPAGLRRELLSALAWHGLGWSFPQGARPTTIGDGYVICDLVPQVRDRSPSTTERVEGGLRIINHEDPGIDYRVRLTFDTSSRHLRKRELIGERGTVWYVEHYQVEANPAIPDAEFQVPEK